MLSLLANPVSSDLESFFSPLSSRPLRRLVTTRPRKLDIFSMLDSDTFNQGLRSLPQIQDKDDKYVIQVATPGVKQQDLSLELIGRRQLAVSAGGSSKGLENTTTQAADAGSDQSSAQGAPTVQNIADQSLRLRKTVTLPQDSKIDTMRVSYADGMVTIEVTKRTADDVKAEEDDEETAGLEADLKRKRERFEGLREELYAERKTVAEAEAKLREARALKQQRIAEERRQLTIAQQE